MSQEVIDLAAVLNALRVVFPTDELSDDNTTDDRVRFQNAANRRDYQFRLVQSFNLPARTPICDAWKPKTLT